MTPLPSITDTFRVAIRWQTTKFSQHAANVMHFHAPGKTASQVWTDLDTNVTANMWRHMSDQETALDVTITPLNGIGLTEVHLPTGAKWAGIAHALKEISPASAVVVKCTTGFRGRANRGRLFLPWACEEVITNGKFNVGDQGPMQTAFNTFLAAMIAAGTKPCVASYKYALQNEILGYVVESNLGTQRRRQPR